MSVFDPGYYTEHDLQEIGFKSLGSNILLAKNCTIIGVGNISIGDNVRIDGYSSIIAGDGGWVSIGAHIHIGGYCFLAAGDGIQLEDFSGLSQGVRIYSRTDDYSGEHLTNPTIPEKYTGVVGGTVSIGRHVIVGSGCVVLPTVRIDDGVAVGALSLVNRNLDSWGVYSGVPARRLKDRSRRLLELETQLKADGAK